MSNSIKYRRDIDGLRAIAVLSVILFHLDERWLPGGFLGVDVFFVISGYLITKIIFRELQENRFSLPGFYQRRIRRIIPALSIMLITTTFFAALILFPDEFTDYARSLSYASLQISNFHFQQVRDYFDESIKSEVLLHTWSLGVEEQFYVFWPLILIISFKLCRNGMPWIIAAFIILSVVFSEYTARHYPLLSFYSLPSRVFELALGGILSFANKEASTEHLNNYLVQGASILAALVLLACFVLFTPEMRFPGVIALVPCLAVTWLIFAGQYHQSIVHKLFSSRSLVMVGLLSYSLYLWHWPIIVLYKTYTQTPVLNAPTSLVLVTATFAISYFSYRFVEQPFRQTGKASTALRTSHDTAQGSAQ